jgi:hypothetical protein
MVHAVPRAWDLNDMHARIRVDHWLGDVSAKQRRSSTTDHQRRAPQRLDKWPLLEKQYVASA